MCSTSRRRKLRMRMFSVRSSVWGRKHFKMKGFFSNSPLLGQKYLAQMWEQNVRPYVITCVSARLCPWCFQLLLPCWECWDLGACVLNNSSDPEVLKVHIPGSTTWDLFNLENYNFKITVYWGYTIRHALLLAYSSWCRPTRPHRTASLGRWL